MFNFIKTMLIGLVIVLTASAHAGDTQGKVDKVKVLGQSNGIRIYLSAIENDRWGCIQDKGYVVVREATSTVDAKSLDRILSLALTAMSTGYTLGIDSQAGDPCNNGSQGFLIKQ